MAHIISAGGACPGCSGGCSSGCKGGCTGSCLGHCTIGCSEGCSTGCGAVCAKNCTTGCKDGCKGTCTGLCTNSASSAGPSTASGTSSKKDDTLYYVKYSDIYEEYPHTSTSNAKLWKADRDKGILYTRLSTLDELFTYYTDTLKPYYEDADNFKLTDDEAESLSEADKNKLIKSKKDDWADKHHYKYYELLYNLCNEEENDDELTKQKKAAAKELFNQRYNQFIKDYEAFVDTNEEDYNAETLIEYNINGLLLLYPTMSEDIASEIQVRNTVYETYKKILEKKLKTYQSDLEALEKIEDTLTRSTSQWEDEIDEYDDNYNLLDREEYSVLRDVNINRRYKNYGDSLLYDDGEIDNLLELIETAGDVYVSKLEEINGFPDLYVSYYQDESDRVAEKIVEVLADEYNKSELNKVKRILDKYDDKQEEDSDVKEYEEKRDKLIAERDAKTAGYNAQLQKILETIDTYISYKNNVLAEIDLLQNEIDQYTAEIANAKNKINAANAELNKYPDDEIESDNLIDYFAQNPDIQKNVNILKTYLNWLNEIEQNIKRDIAASIGKAADSIDNYLEVLKELITKYIHEAFYFFHHYDSLEEDIEEIIENNLEDKNLTLNSFKNILYLGDNLLDENVDENSEDYPTLCKEALEKLLILSSNDSESHTYNFGIYKYENDFYLMGLDKNDSDMYYPIPQWIGAEEAESFVEEEILQYAESRGIEGELDILSNISIIEPTANGSWVQDPTSSPVYRILPANTSYNEEKEYYNVDQTVYQYIDESTWISDVENRRVMWKTGFKAKIFEISDYTMLYDYLVFNPKLEGRIDAAIENSIIFLPLDPSYPIRPHEMATYYQEIIGNAVYEYGEENLIGSLSRLAILENLYRTSFINYIYAFISQLNFETNDGSYKGYLDLKNKWAENKNELSKWLSQLASLQQVYESGWSENTKEADQGKKQQLEDLIYLTNQQISYYELQVRIYERLLDNNYLTLFNTDNLVTEAITATKKEYDINKTTLENEYSMYVGKVNHYLNLLFNDRPLGVPINSSIAHSITDTEYNLGINSAINSYNKYFVLKEEGGQNIDFSALIARIDAFSDNYQKHYNLYELVKPGEEYDDLVYKYYYKVNDSYKPYGDYNAIQWNIDISNEKVYKVNQYLDEFNNIIYTLVPINASYSNEVIYCIKNEKENDYDVLEKESNETQAEYEERWESYKNNNNLYTLTIGENGGILQFLNNLLANSEYVQNIIKIYNDSLALYDSLVQLQLGDDSSYQELIEAKNRYEQQLRDLQEITQYKDAADIDHAQAYLDIMAALAKYLQVLTITYIEAVEKRYGVS